MYTNRPGTATPFAMLTFCHVHSLGNGDSEGDGDGEGESDGGGDGEDGDGDANGIPPTDRLIAYGFLIEQMQRKRGGETAN